MQIQEQIKQVTYDNNIEALVFHQEVNGFLVPFSIVLIDLQSDRNYFPTDIPKITMLFGITYNQIVEGMALCNQIHGC